MTTRLDISIGPVQGFVSQSRRTRDLWGSSYLLAFLSAHAMRGAEKAGGEIIQPAVKDDSLYRWVSGHRTGDPPRFGTLPNHFVAEVDGDARRIAEAAVGSLTAAWKRVHDAVWERFVAHACPAGNDTDAIWNRQVGTFWEVMWTAAPSGDRGGAFARRKHWRSHRRQDELGDKCTVMHDLQELSGHVRARNRSAQDHFWRCVHDRIGSLDLRDNERLCAIAFVKRLFPKVASGALGWDVDASRWPSTVYVGAVPWMRRVVSAVPRQAAEYADAVSRYGLADVRTMPRPPFGLAVPAAGDFPRLDANYLHRAFVTSDRLCPLGDGAGIGAGSGPREGLAERLQTIYDTVHEDGRLGPPPSFHALLFADGDRLGELLAKLGGDTVSKALRVFTSGVPEVVEKHDGMTVYAGGDDVLAMLPAPNALACAQALSDAYRNAFADTDAKDEATLSAASVFAHIRLPLSYVLGEAHWLLDAVAKDGNGRDSLVAAVLKPGGPYCQWVTTWTRPGPDGAARATDQLHDLLRQLDTNAAEPGLSSALVYRVRDTLTRLCGWEQWQPGNWGNLPEDVDIRAFLRAEIHHSLDVRTDGTVEVRACMLTESVWNLLGPARNPRTDPGVMAKDNGDGAVAQAGVDALLFARFLADPEPRESDR